MAYQKVEVSIWWAQKRVRRTNLVGSVLGQGWWVSVKREDAANWVCSLNEKVLSHKQTGDQ